MNTGARRIGYLLSGTLLAAGAHAADITLYSDDDFQGRALGVIIDERQLGVLNFARRASSVVIDKGAWILCTDEDYGGQCITLEPGRYTSLQALGLNDAVTSVRRRDPADIGVFSEPRKAADIVLYASNDYAGASHPVEQAQPDLKTLPLKGEATSAVIASGKWELCSDAQFQGACVTLGPGKYPALKDYGLAGGASSVRRAPGPASEAPPHQ